VDWDCKCGISPLMVVVGELTQFVRHVLGQVVFWGTEKSVNPTLLKLPHILDNEERRWRRAIQHEEYWRSRIYVLHSSTKLEYIGGRNDGKYGMIG